MKKYDFRGKFVAVVGSARFHDLHLSVFGELTRDGAIVLPILSSAFRPDTERETIEDNFQKKLGRCDAVYVVNPSVHVCSSCRKPCAETYRGSDCCLRCVITEPYIGEHTRSEVATAVDRGVDVVYMNEPCSLVAPAHTEKTYTWEEVKQYIDVERACCIGTVKALYDECLEKGSYFGSLLEASQKIAQRVGYVHPLGVSCGLKELPQPDKSETRTRRELPGKLYGAVRSDGWWLRVSGEKHLGEWYSWFKAEYCLLGDIGKVMILASSARSRLSVPGISLTVEVVEFSLGSPEVIATMAQTSSDAAKKSANALTLAPR